MKDTVLAMKTLDGEAEAIRSIDHARKLNRAVVRIEGRALDLKGRSARGETEQLRVLLATNHLDGADGPSGHDAIKRLHREIEGTFEQLGLRELGKALWRKVGIEQRDGLAVDRRQPADQEQLSFARLQCPGDRPVGHDQPSVADMDNRFQALGAHALGEARENGDLLVDLRLLDKGPTPARPMEVALFGEVEDGLADGGQTDAQLIGVFALAR